MFSNISSIWFLILYATIVSDFNKAINYKCAYESYTNTSMDETVTYQVISKSHKPHITRQILNFADLHILPHNFTSLTWQMKKSASQYLYDIFKNTLYKDAEQSYNCKRRNHKTIEKSDIIMSYTAFLHHSDIIFMWFDVSITPKIDYVIDAELHLHPKISDNTYKILVYNVLPSIKNQKRLWFINSVVVTANHNGWIQVNITEALQYWLNHPNLNYGLHLYVQNMPEKINVGVKTIENFAINQSDVHPFLVGYFSSFQVSNDHLTGPTRWKRSELYSSVPVNNKDNFYNYKNSSKYNSNSGSCTLKKLYVSFREIEFNDFISAPDGYEAQYCSGECRFPLNAHMNATNHAIVQTLVHFLTPRRAPKSCCVPRELAHLPVLYSRDGYNHMLKRYRNMIAKSCGCY